MAGSVARADVSEKKNEAAAPLRTGAGTLESVNEKDRTITLKRAFFKKTFNLGDNCVIAAPEKPRASLQDLQHGEWTTVEYREVEKVPVAAKVKQSLATVSGSITAIDRDKRLLKVDTGMFVRNYAVAGDCKVRLHDGESGRLGDLQIGQHVTVAWAKAEGTDIARRIEQTGTTFTGRVTAIDLSMKTVKVKALLGEKKFHIGGDCKVVVGSRIAPLEKLNVGQAATVSYTVVDGVMIAQRVAQDQQTASAAATAAAPEEQPRQKELVESPAP